MTSDSDKIPEVATWAQFAEEIGGTFTEGPHSKPSVMHIAVPGTVRFAFQDWEILIDCVTLPAAQNKTPRPTTRFRTLFTNNEDFRFKIYRELDDIMMSALKFLRLMKDVQIGVPEFDDQFIMRGTEDEKVIRFFSDPAFQEAIKPLPKLAVLQVFDDDSNIFKRRLSKGVDILSLSLHGVISDIETLRSMKTLFEAALERLVGLGEADEKRPEGELPV